MFIMSINYKSNVIKCAVIWQSLNIGEQNKSREIKKAREKSTDEKNVGGKKVSERKSIKIKYKKFIFYFYQFVIFYRFPNHAKSYAKVFQAQSR